jgi:hypothetical protein
LKLNEVGGGTLGDSINPLLLPPPLKPEPPLRPEVELKPEPPLKPELAKLETVERLTDTELFELIARLLKPLKPERDSPTDKALDSLTLRLGSLKIIPLLPLLFKLEILP